MKYTLIFDAVLTGQEATELDLVNGRIDDFYIPGLLSMPQKLQDAKIKKVIMDYLYPRFVELKTMWINCSWQVVNSPMALGE